jgi:glycosyltransferase involved in cell wall biosynthesis
MTRGSSRQPVVLHVLEALEGGTARHIVDVVRHVGSVQHVVALPEERVGWATDRRARRSIEDAGGTVTTVHMRRSPTDPHNVIALRHLRRLLRDRRPSIVHGHSSVGGALARLAAWRDDVPVVYTPNGVTTARAGIQVERALARRTTRLVAVSQSERDLAISLRLAPPDHIELIPNGLDLAVDGQTGGRELRSALGIPADATVLGTISRLVPQKAPEVFVRAAILVAQQHPSIHVVAIGSGPLRPSVVAEAAPLGSRFHLLDSVEDGGSAIASFDVFALASRFEGAPYTPLEAMRAGVPVVLTDVVGSRDIVEDDVSGLLVPVDQPAALADAICRVLANGTGTRLAARASEQLTRFDVRHMGAALGRLYEELAAREANWRA